MVLPPHRGCEGPLVTMRAASRFPLTANKPSRAIESSVLRSGDDQELCAIWRGRVQSLGVGKEDTGEPRFAHLDIPVQILLLSS